MDLKRWQVYLKKRVPQFLISWSWKRSIFFETQIRIIGPDIRTFQCFRHFKGTSLNLFLARTMSWTTFSQHVVLGKLGCSQRRSWRCFAVILLVYQALAVKPFSVWLLWEFCPKQSEVVLSWILDWFCSLYLLVISAWHETLSFFARTDWERLLRSRLHIWSSTNTLLKLQIALQLPWSGLLNLP